MCLLQGHEWIPVSDLCAQGRGRATAIEWPGPDNDLAWFELIAVHARSDGAFDVVGTHMESDRCWTAQFGGDELLLVAAE